MPSTPTNSHTDKIIHCVVIYPFRGLEIGSPPHAIFKRLIGQCKQSSGGANPIVVLNQRSGKKDAAHTILKELEVEIVKYWGADTCDNWLAGWGFILDQLETIRSDLKNPEENQRIALIPGDIQQVENDNKFFENLDEFIRYDGKPFLLGDFRSVNLFSTKELIDSYGIYLLIANWFPDAWKAIRTSQICKPRSEFLNIRVPELRQLLKHRVFAYEQTLNMLILLWNSCWKKANLDPAQAHGLWHESVHKMDLGNMADDPADRSFKGAIDQIERTERMLRLIWRESKRWGLEEGPGRFRKLAKEYERLDGHSTRIRDAAQIAMWAQIDSR
ncbi:MAG: hypothetical protein ACREA2_11785 [Blastocatellia bacterium]